MLIDNYKTLIISCFQNNNFLFYFIKIETIRKVFK